MSLFGANKSKDIKDVVSILHEGATAICNPGVASNLSNEAEVHNLADEIKNLMVESYAGSVGADLQDLINEDAENAAKIFINSVNESSNLPGNNGGAMNENALAVQMLTTSIATTMRSPYEAVVHRMFDTRVVSDRPVVTIEEVVPTVKDCNPGSEAIPIIEAFDPKKTTNFFVDRTELTLEKLTNGIAPGEKNVNILENLDSIFKVDRSIRLTGISASEIISGTPTPIAASKIRMKKGSVPYFDVKDSKLSVTFEITMNDGTVNDVEVTAKMDYTTGVMKSVGSDDECVTKVFFDGVVSHEEHTHPITTGFTNSFNEFPIPTRPHIEVSVPQETATDTANSNSKLASTDLITLLTQQASIVSSRLEDQRLLKVLNSGSMFQAQFDFEPPVQFVHGNLEWIKREFIPFLDQCAMAMKAEYMLEDCHFRVGVSPFILKILDAEYNKDKGASEQNGGSGPINYSMAVKTSTATFFLISSLVLPADKLKVNAIPNNFKDGVVKTYHYFKYSSFVTDKIRKASNPRLSALVFSERNLPMVMTKLSTEVTLTNMPITLTSGSRFIKKVF